MYNSKSERTTHQYIHKSNMTNEIEEKMNQLRKLTDVSQSVVRKYIEKECLPKYDGYLKNVLNEYKHDLFHLYYNTTCCCKCPRGRPQLHRDQQIFYPQLKKLFKSEGKGKHEQIEKPTRRGKPIVTMHCLCNLNATSSLDLLDLPLMVIVLKNCFWPKYDTHVQNWIATLLKVRNFVSHTGSVTAYTVIEIDTNIKNLKYAVLKLAGLVTLQDGEYKQNVKRKIADIMTHQREVIVTTQEMERNQDVPEAELYLDNTAADKYVQPRTKNQSNGNSKKLETIVSDLQNAGSSVNRLDHIPEEMANTNKKLDVVITNSENLLIKVQDIQQCQLNSESRIVKEIGHMKIQHHDDISLLKIDIQSLSSNHSLHKEATDKETELLDTKKKNEKLEKRIRELEGLLEEKKVFVQEH